VDEQLRLRVQERLGLDVDSIVRIDHGWDSVAYDINDSWIVRVPRRAEVRAALRQEAELLPRLAPELPAPVPVVSVFEGDQTFFAVHRKLPGRPLRSAELVVARDLGRFLGVLHCSATAKEVLPETTSRDWLDSQAAFADRCKAVLALMDRDERLRAQALFDRHLSRPPHFELVPVQGDLGPDHILWSDEHLTGVIDWSDARIDDPALDFAWLLYGCTKDFAETVLETYSAEGGDVDPTFRERALYFHRLGPWHQVVFGLERGRPELVEPGLAGIRERLQ